MINAKDLTTALTSLNRAKGYAVTVILTLGMTLGALVTMFNLNYQLLAAPLPYPDGDRLYISQGNVYKDGQLEFSDGSPYPALIDSYSKDNNYFEQKALVNFDFDNIRNLPDSPRVRTSYITPEYLQLLQTPLALGRAFNSSEGLDSRNPVAVLSYSSWQQLFDQDPDVLGKFLRFGNVDFQIIGVTSEEFVEPQLAGPDWLTQVWLPWDYNPAASVTRNTWGNVQGGRYLVGKLRPDVKPIQAQQELTNRLNTRFEEENAGESFFDDFTIDMQLISYRKTILGDSEGRVLLLLAGILALVLIAAANITNLILAHAANQHKKMAIQAALGAQKSHLFNAVFSEILLLVSSSAILSLIVAYGGIALLETLTQNRLPRIAELSMNWQSIGFALLTALSLSLIFTFLVSRQIDYRALHGLMQSSGKGIGIQVPAKVRRLLILSQIALTSALLSVSLQILQQSLQHILQPLGFATEDIYQFTLNMGSVQDNNRPKNLIAIRKELLENPKIINASLASGSPTDPMRRQGYLSTDPDFNQLERADTTFIDENYLNILHLQMIAGRHISAEEFQEQARVIVVNKTFSDNLQTDGDVLNKNFYMENGRMTDKIPYKVIGIARDLNLPGRKEVPRMFVPVLNAASPLLLLKLQPGQEFTNAELNELMARVTSQYKVSELLSMKRAHQLLLARDTLSAGITIALTLLALGLAAIGLYGVLSYSVLVRRFELGIRMAVGARPFGVFLQVLKDNLAPVLLGLVLALAAVTGLWLWIRQSSYSIQASASGWLFPTLLILALVSAVTLLSVWRIINRPAIDALQGHH